MARARRGRGEGSIYQRADGYWCANVSVGYSDTGKRRRRTVYGATKKEVQDRLRQLSTEVVGGAIESQKVTVGEYLDRWLRTIKQTVAPNTHKRYEVSVKHQLKPFIGGLRLTRLEPLHVEQLYVTLRDEKCSARTIQLAGITLGRALQHAVKLRIVMFNAARGISKPRVPQKEMKVWDAAQVGLFLAAAKSDRLFSMYVLALAAGLRQGELFGLQWTDVDLDAGSVTVRRSLEELNGKHRLKEPKTGGGRRVDLPKFAIDALREHRKLMLAEGNIAGPVFCTPNGEWLRKSNVCRRSWKPLVKAAGVPSIRFHDMRHTSATLLLEAGENVKVISERLGHASVNITLAVYAHATPTMQKAAADRMQQLLG